LKTVLGLPFGENRIIVGLSKLCHNVRQRNMTIHCTYYHI